MSQDPVLYAGDAMANAMQSYFEAQEREKWARSRDEEAQASSDVAIAELAMQRTLAVWQNLRKTDGGALGG